jgi:restriction endonuclease S subunit
MNWTQVALRDVLRLNPATTTLNESAVYKQAVLRPYPRGVILKSVKHGLDFPRRRQKPIRGGQFVISKRHAHQKVWGIVPPALNEAVIALGSLVFDIQPNLSVDYLAAYLSTYRFRQAVFAACSQHGYLDVQQFTDISIPLASLEDQRHVAELWEWANAALAHTREMYASIAALKSGVSRELFGTLNSSWETKKLGECARIGQEQTQDYRLIVIPPDQITHGTSLLGEPGVGIQPDFELESLYLYYYLENQKSVLRSASNAAEVESRLNSLSISLPTFYEQRKIATAMQQHDEALMRIRTEQIELHKLIDALLHRIFSGTLDLQGAVPILRRFLSVTVD